MSKVLSACFLKKLSNKRAAEAYSAPISASGTARLFKLSNLLQLVSQRLRDALFPAQTHVRFALAHAALPRKQAEQGKERPLKHALAWQTTIFLVATIGAGPHMNLIGLKTGEASKINGRIP